MTAITRFLTDEPLSVIIDRYPQSAEFLANYNLTQLDRSKTLIDALADIPQEELAEFALTADDLIKGLGDFLHALYIKRDLPETIRSVTIIGGQNKKGEKESACLAIYTGEIVSIVGPTGSGKSRLLGDIECLAQGDTPSRRTIRINDRPLSDEERFRMGTHLVAQLSQNMNFVLDVSVDEFLRMHAQSRLIDDDALIDACYRAAVDLAGEPFTRDTKVTELSGGQSRALMIADTAYISESPIVLIDEIENAGIDRDRALAVLTKNNKIVLISTHDPMLALRADRRIVIQEGGIKDVLETTPQEKASLLYIEKLEQTLSAVRHDLRCGNRINCSADKSL